MPRSTRRKILRWARFIGPFVIAYCILGLLVEAAVPEFLPDSFLTRSVAEAARAGVFAIWLFLIWRIFDAIRGIYGPQSSYYLENTALWRILLNIVAAFALAAFCFSVIYVYIVRQNSDAFSTALTLGDAMYFSLVTMTTTGYGDVIPKSGLAKFVVCVQILFGFLYNVLFFSVFAGLAGRKRAGL